MRQARLPSLNADDYLEGELKSDIRHEFVNGEVYAMVGAGEAHNLIALNVASRLRAAARGGPCRVFISDMKVRVAARAQGHALHLTILPPDHVYSIDFVLGLPI